MTDEPRITGEPRIKVAPRNSNGVPHFAPNFTVYVQSPNVVCLYSEDRKFLPARRALLCAGVRNWNRREELSMFSVNQLRSNGRPSGRFATNASDIFQPASCIPGRLYDVPVKLGLLDRPRSEAELNPIHLHT